MFKIHTTPKIFLLGLIISFVFTSCFNSRKVAYFSNVSDSARIAAVSGLEPVIQKKDILSISVSSLSSEATIIFNTPNLPITPAATPNNLSPQTAGYLVGENGMIKFPVLGDLPAEGLSQKQLENNITQLLLNKKLLFDPIVSVRYLNFRVTVLGEVLNPGVVNVPSEQISILEALGQAGDLTIYGRRENIILIRQEGDQKIMKRLDLTSSNILQSPYYYLKSNDVIYVEPGKGKLASTDATLRILPVVFSGVSVIVVVLNSLIK